MLHTDNETVQYMFLYLSGILVIPNMSLDTIRKNKYYQFYPQQRRISKLFHG